MLGAVLLVLAASVPPPAAARPSPKAEVFRYVLAESRTVVSPAGERASAVRGPVTVLDGSARWDLEGGTFPGTGADALLLGERGGWLVDRKAFVAARASRDDVRELFVPPAGGDPGPFQASVRDVDVSAAAPSRGPAFEGRATSRLRATASWNVVTSMPGSVGRIRCRLSAAVHALDETPAGARSPLDDPGRLLDVPEAVREALEPELARLRGLAVRVVVETQAEQAVDYPGTAAPPVERAPLRTTTTTTRELSGLVSRPAAAADAAAFRLAEEWRVVGIERLVPRAETLR